MAIIVCAQPQCRCVKWSQNKTEVSAALALTQRQAAYQDGWAVIVTGQGAGQKPVVAFCNEGQYVMIDTGEVMTAAQILARYPGTVL